MEYPLMCILPMSQNNECYDIIVVAKRPKCPYKKIYW